MENSEYENQIETIANLIKQDNVSPDEQDATKLNKYHEYAKTNYNLKDEAATQLIYEALLYLKIKSADSVDPLQEGDKFGAGFS